MTVLEFKRHMDRRFDRVQRTKADKADLRRFATKGQLRRFATRKDLERFATKKDLERFATKKDLERYATKKDLERYATKEEISVQFADVYRRLDSLNDKVDSILRALSQQRAHDDRVWSEFHNRLVDLERGA